MAIHPYLAAPHFRIVALLLGAALEEEKAAVVAGFEPTLADFEKATNSTKMALEDALLGTIRIIHLMLFEPTTFTWIWDHGIASGISLVIMLQKYVVACIVLIGEIGGTAEEDVAAFIKESGTRKPVVSLIPRLTASARRRMGHAGEASVQHKIKSLREACVTVVESPEMIGDTMFKVLKRHGLFTQENLRKKRHSVFPRG